MKFHYHLLINQSSGSGNGGKTAKKITALIQKKGLLYTTYYTTYAGEEEEIVQRLCKDALQPWDDQLDETSSFPLLVVLGGDGTLHQVVNAIQKIDQHIPVAYIPAGSGNDFARGVGLPLEAEKAFWHIFKTPAPQTIPVISYEERATNESGIAVNNVGIGLDAAIVAATNESAAKKHLNKYNLGSLSYIVSIIKLLFKQPGFPILVEANGQTINYEKAFLCTTTNHPYFGGGVAIAPTADIHEKGLDFVLVERINLFKIFRLILLLTRKKHMQSKHFHHIQANKIHILSTVAQYCQADGEIIGNRPYDIILTSKEQLFWV